MIETIKRLKLAYTLFNIFHKRKLDHNVPLYKKLGLQKNYFSPVSSKDFVNAEAALLKAETQKNLTPEETALYTCLNDEGRKSVSDFNKNGFAILKNYLSNEAADGVNEEIEKLVKSGNVKFRYGNKIMFAIHKSARLLDIGNDKKLVGLLSSLLQGNAKLFQSINFIMGSEQKTHSDSIHMTTYPLGGLLGVWIALEDVNDENGPLHYFPGSHVLPYYLNSDYDNEGNAFFIGDKGYKEYEKMLERKIAEHGIQKQVFHAKKGDLLIWHANLFHGGEPHLNKSKTRKSMVFHYFRENSICYHEITQRPALMM